MRTCEILILSTLFVRLVGYSFPCIQKRRWIHFLPGVTLLLIVIHLIVEKFRLQMMPAYGLTLLFVFLSIHHLKPGKRLPQEKKASRVWLFFGSLFRFLIFILISTLPILLPVFRFPNPTGEYPVGTTYLHLVDMARPESYSPEPDDHRELMVRVWYPAIEEAGAILAPLMENMPIQFNHLSLVKTHAFLDAPINNAQSLYPVLIFSHGHVGFMEQNLTQMEELASHGYIVCSVSHPYHTIATVFPDGRVIQVDPLLANTLLKGETVPLAVYPEHMDIWTEDTHFLIDELESIQAGERESLLAGRLDMTRLGILGQSFGGVIAVRACMLDERCQAGLSLDSSLPIDYASLAGDHPLKAPFMFLWNEVAAHDTNWILGSLKTTAYGVSIRGSTHFNFTDLFLYSPAFIFGDALGSIGGHRMVEIVNAYTLAFFDETLKGESSSYLDGPSPDYPEVTIKRR